MEATPRRRGAGSTPLPRGERVGPLHPHLRIHGEARPRDPAISTRLDHSRVPMSTAHQYGPSTRRAGGLWPREQTFLRSAMDSNSPSTETRRPQHTHTP
eukprot:3225202-Prorocentrum_lima.AAC.1